MKWLAIVPRGGPVLAVATICCACWIKTYKDPSARITILVDKSYPRVHYLPLLSHFPSSFSWKTGEVSPRPEILTQDLLHSLPGYDALLAASPKVVPLARLPGRVEVIGTLRNQLIHYCPPSPVDLLGKRIDGIFENPPFHWNFSISVREICSAWWFKNWIFDSDDLPDVLIRWAERGRFNHSRTSTLTLGR